MWTGRFRLRLSRLDIGPDHIQIACCSFERLLRIVVRNKSHVIVKSQIAFAPEAIKDSQQSGVFLSMRDRTKSMIAMWCPGWLLARNPWLNIKPRELLALPRTLVEGKPLHQKRESCEPRRASCPHTRESVRSVPSQRRAVLASSSGATSGIRLLCQTFSRNASLRARRDSNSFGVKTV